MSTQIQTVCDICSKVKGDANHWWKLAVRSSAQTGLPTLIIMAPNEEFSGVADICSHNCATQALARFLDHGTLENLASASKEEPCPEPRAKTKK